MKVKSGSEVAQSYLTEQTDAPKWEFLATEGRGIWNPPFSEGASAGGTKARASLWSLETSVAAGECGPGFWGLVMAAPCCTDWCIFSSSGD